MIIPILLLGLGLAFVVAEVLFPSFGVLSVLALLIEQCPGGLWLWHGSAPS